MGLLSQTEPIGQIAKEDRRNDVNAPLSPKQIKVLKKDMEDRIKTRREMEGVTLDFIYKFIEDSKVFKENTYTLISKLNSDHEEYNCWVKFKKKKKRCSIKVYKDQVLRSFQSWKVKDFNDTWFFNGMLTGIRTLNSWVWLQPEDLLEEGIVEFCKMVDKFKSKGYSIEKPVKYRNNPNQFHLKYTEDKKDFEIVIKTNGEPSTVLRHRLKDFDLDDISRALSKQIEKFTKDLYKKDTFNFQ